jgi:DNA-binding NarL/FixJ family response regulator
MTRVVVIADSGSTLKALTGAVMTVRGAEIVRYGNIRTRLDRLLASAAPDLVVIGDLRIAQQALIRLAEVRRAAPAAKVVLLSSSSGAAWLADALRAEASAVLPGNPEPRVLGIVLRDVLAQPEGAAPAAADSNRARTPSPAAERGHAGRRRVRRAPAPRRKAAA